MPSRTDKLGLYSDSVAEGDTLELPAHRLNSLCLNCNYPWGSHMGWACDYPNPPPFPSFYEIPHKERYLTAAMKKSSLPCLTLPEKVSKTPDASNWRAWVRQVPGECDCGINRQDCTYHKDPGT